MKHSDKTAIFIAIAGFLLSSAAVAAKRDIQELRDAAEQMDARLQKLEAGRDNQILMELMKTIDQLKEEVQQLRGDLEQLTHDVEGMGDRQRNLYLDIDRRLNDLQLSGSDTGVRPHELEVATEPQKDIKPVSRDKSNAPVDEEQAREVYSTSFQLLKEGRYPEAATAFQAFLASYTNSRYAENAQYWLGEAYYAAGKYEQALVEFQKVLDAYPGSTKVPGAKLKMGYTYYELQRWKETREILNDVLRNYPSSSVAPLAEKRLIRMTKDGH